MRIRGQRIKRTRLCPRSTGRHANAVAWSPDSRYLVTVGGAMRQPGEVLLWDLAAAGIVEAE